MAKPWSHVMAWPQACHDVDLDTFSWGDGQRMSSAGRTEASPSVPQFLRFNQGPILAANPRMREPLSAMIADLRSSAVQSAWRVGWRVGQKLCYRGLSQNGSTI